MRRILLSLIDEVLTLSRVEAGREVAHPEHVPVFAAVHEAAIIVEPLAHDKELEVRVLAVPRDLEVWADPVKLRQILLNLLTNAIKFTDAGSVEIESRQLDDCVEILVRDTGIGIAPANQDRIFDAFWQVEQKSTRKVGGAGLGLSVSRRLHVSCTGISPFSRSSVREARSRFVFRRATLREEFLICTDAAGHCASGADHVFSETPGLPGLAG